jgi:hypothetical protein
MNTYCVSFRIADRTVAGKTYQERYDCLMNNLKSTQVKGSGFWMEPTSFALVESHLDTESFAAKAVSGLDKKNDIVFVFDPQDMSARYIGVEHKDVLASFFPKAEQF